MPRTQLKDSQHAPLFSLATAESLAGSNRYSEPVLDSDEELLQRIRLGDGMAVLEAYDRYQLSIYQYVWQMSSDAGVAADVTQEVFLMMLERGGLLGRFLSRFDPAKGSLEAYLMGVARKLTRKAQGNDRHWLPLDEEPLARWSLAGSEELESMLVSRFTAARLRSAIARLPLKYREVIVLCCLQEKSYEQTAAILRCSMGTVASRLSRARRLLAERL
jgi:RNA polymerase sigma-70 factor, ECF subfamily